MSEEERSLMIKYLLLTQKYRLDVCTTCLGTQQQKDRKCSLFRGLEKPTCEMMTKHIDRKMKDCNQEFMQKVLQKDYDFGKQDVGKEE